MVVSGVSRHCLLDLQPRASTVSVELYFYSSVSIYCSAIFLPSNARLGFTLRRTNQYQWPAFFDVSTGRVFYEIGGKICG